MHGPVAVYGALSPTLILGETHRFLLERPVVSRGEYPSRVPIRSGAKHSQCLSGQHHSVTTTILGLVSRLRPNARLRFDLRPLCGACLSTSASRKKRKSQHASHIV